MVGSKRNQVWIWLAIDSFTKEIVAMSVGDRDVAKGDRALWAHRRNLGESLAAIDRQCATCYTDYPP